MESLSQQLAELVRALNQVGATVEGASIGLQVKLDKASDRLGTSLDASIKSLVESMEHVANTSRPAYLFVGLSRRHRCTRGHSSPAVFWRGPLAKVSEAILAPGMFAHI